MTLNDLHVHMQWFMVFKTKVRCDLMCDKSLKYASDLGFEITSSEPLSYYCFKNDKPPWARILSGIF